MISESHSDRLLAKEDDIMAANPIPEGYGTVTPYLYIRDAARAIEFYKQALGATELFRLADPSGKIGHAELQIGNSRIMLADEHPAMNALGPQSLGGTSVSFLIYVEDVDTSFKQAVAAGATEKRPVTDQFYGDRSGTFEDAFGHYWTIATHMEDVSPDEIERRFKEAMKPG
jgi:PhnB protein